MEFILAKCTFRIFFVYVDLHIGAYRSQGEGTAPANAERKTERKENMVSETKLGKQQQANEPWLQNKNKSATCSTFSPSVSKCIYEP